MFTDEQLERLNAPIDPSRVKQREGSGRKSLSYIEAHDAISTANTIFGIGGWGYTVQELTPLGEPEAISRDGRKGYRVGYRALVEVNINQGGVTFSDVGYGDGQDYSGSTMSVHELAMKEAVSDGVKRALKNLGPQFGLSLYDKEARADIEKRAKLANASASTLKQEVWKIAKSRLEKDRPTLKAVGELFGVDPAELTEVETLKTILRSEGLL